MIQILTHRCFWGKTHLFDFEMRDGRDDKWALEQISKLYRKSYFNPETAKGELVFLSRYHENKEKYNKARRNSTLKRRYGITEDEYFQMFNAQKGKCKLCGKTKPRNGAKHLIIDHCHSTGKVRGLLCNDCNVLLGKLKDDIDYIDRIKDYLTASF